MSAITERLQLLGELNFGTQVAEDEVARLQDYFVQTEQWRRIQGGDVDIVRGGKGAGKSALYLLLDKQKESLFDRRILTASAENPRGATVFKDLVSDPPTSEQEFIILWKLYILSLIAHEMRSYGIANEEARSVFGVLEDAQLLDRERNLSGKLRAAQGLARRLLGITAIEGGISLDPYSGTPNGISGRISLGEPTSESRLAGCNSIDNLLDKLNAALAEAQFTIWILMDRLDVAFAESHELEANAIRALIRTYNDFRNFDHFALKIFLREDIWKRVTEKGFREASHVIRYEVMQWTSPMLLNLIMRRVLSNDVFNRMYNVSRDEILGNAVQQRDLFNRIFPAQVEQGPRKSATFDWMISRCTDATNVTAPREVIHLLNCLKQEEIQRLERGENLPPGEQLFDRSVFKQALPRVSETRLISYLYAEYPQVRCLVEKLRGEKAEQNPESLAEIWTLERSAAIKEADELVKLGFFQVRGTRSEPTYWVPFLYRDALNLVQGKAGGAPGEEEEDVT
jgi:hypothetical protein